jgi:hypothetical protein
MCRYPGLVPGMAAEIPRDDIGHLLGEESVIYASNLVKFSSLRVLS